MRKVVKKERSRSAGFSEALVKFNARPRVVTDKPRLSPGLGWLQGIFLRVRGLGLMPNLMLLLHGILQDKNADSLKNNSNPMGGDIAALPNQRWILRKRNKRGQLKHLTTLDHAPTDDEMRKHGEGSYSILTTKPLLQSWKSVTIGDRSKTRLREPSPLPSRTVPPIPATTTVVETNVGRPKKRYLPKIKVRKPSKELPTKKETSVESATKDINSVAAPVISVTTTALPAVRRVTQEPVREPFSGTWEEPQDLAKPVREERCSKCLEVPSSLIRCGFCKEIFCNDSLDECYENHECNGSKVCHKCGRRVPNVLVEMADLCHLSFCSLKCEKECRRRNLMKLACVGCSPGSDDESKKKEVDVKMDEGDGYENKSPEEDEPDEDVEETCGGRPKRIACRKCQKDNCQGRFCDKYCDKCHFHCEVRCENDGKCKFCTEFDSCEIRCIEAPDRCDKKHCRGFGCEDRWASGTECCEKCKDCGEEGCYFLRSPEGEDSADDEE